MIVIGEDIGRVGGLFRATEGLYERYGAERIRDTPLTESGFVGCGIGAALTGLRPVVELQFSDFAGVAFDQILNQAAKLRFMMGGTPSIPLVIRMVSGGGVRLGAQHSQSLEALFAHIPGLLVAMPSTPYDAKGLLSAAIRGDNPVIFLEQKLLFFGEAAPVPEERYGIELGVGRIARAGTDVTVVALGAQVPHALRAAHELEGDGVSVEVVDPRTLVPLDTDLIAASVAKTHRLVVAHEAVRFCGFGGEIAAHVAEHCFWDLDAPVVRVGAASHPMPYQKDLEAATLPGPAEIAAAVRVGRRGGVRPAVSALLDFGGRVVVVTGAGSGLGRGSRSGSPRPAPTSSSTTRARSQGPPTRWPRSKAWAGARWRCGPTSPSPPRWSGCSTRRRRSARSTCS